MTDASPEALGQMPIVDRFARVSTGVKMFLLLSLALLPLVIIILFASLQTTRTADFERRSLIRVALNESARRLGSELATDINALKVATNAYDGEGADRLACDRIGSILSTNAGTPTLFAIVDAQGKTLCRSVGFDTPPAPLPGAASVNAILEPAAARLRIAIGSRTGRIGAVAVYPLAQLASIAQPAGFQPHYALRLMQGDRALMLVDGYDHRLLERSESVSVPVNRMPLSLEMTVRSVPFTASEVLTMLLPLLMWGAAALIGWLVMDRLVLRPLHQLRTAVSAYRPGEVLEPFRKMTTPAREIRDLGQTFRAITETVAAHENELALGLSRQTRLTREVHHRVKNNLQVVASLLNLHARGARSGEAVAAYASIQRRVDALAVVHRNHFAEIEDNRGVALRPLVSEITSNLRATAPREAARLTILIEVPAYYVTQDVAVPIAFMITELVELSMLCDPRAAVEITVGRAGSDNRSWLEARSTAFRDSRKLRDKLAERYGRILEGLARQLRAPLERDGQAGTISAGFSIIDRE